MMSDDSMNSLWNSFNDFMISNHHDNQSTGSISHFNETHSQCSGLDDAQPICFHCYKYLFQSQRPKETIPLIPITSKVEPVGYIFARGLHCSMESKWEGSSPWLPSQTGSLHIGKWGFFVDNPHLDPPQATKTQETRLYL